MNAFEANGPYTFEKAFALAKRCARNGDYQLGDSLTDVAYKFPPNEFEKLLTARQHLSPTDYEIWKEGTYSWTFEYLHKDLSDEHCDLIAKYGDFDQICKTFDLNQLDKETLKKICRSQRDVLSLEHSNRKRDCPPTRK